MTLDVAAIKKDFPLLERDFNYPPIGELLDEVARIRALQADTVAVHA